MDLVSNSAEAYALFDTQATVEPAHDRTADAGRAPFMPEYSAQPVDVGMLVVAACGAILCVFALTHMSMISADLTLAAVDIGGVAHRSQ